MFIASMDSPRSTASCRKRSPEEKCRNPSADATALAVEDFPDPSDPAMVMICFFIKEYSRTGIAMGQSCFKIEGGDLFQDARERAKFADCEFLGTCRRSDTGSFEQWIHGDPERLQAGAEHLAALTEGGGGDAFEDGPACRGQRLGARQDRNNARGDLGGWHKGSSRHIEQDSYLGDPLGEYRQPSVGLAARPGDQTLGNLTLQHQGQALILPDLIEPAEQERGGNIVGQVRNDLARSLADRRDVKLERIAGDYIEAARISRGKLAERRQTAAIAFDCKNAARPRCQQCSR